MVAEEPLYNDPVLPGKAFQLYGLNTNAQPGADTGGLKNVILLSRRLTCFDRKARYTTRTNSAWAVLVFISHPSPGR